jgi:hypothetical protein
VAQHPPDPRNASASTWDADTNRHAGTTSLDAPQNGTQPTQNDPTLEADSWDARTGTFRSNSGEFGLEAPAIIAEQEFAQQRDSNHIDSRMNDPDQQALILESLNDNDPDWGELAFGGRDAAGNWVDGREDPNEFAEISDEVREQIRENDELERG